MATFPDAPQPGADGGEPVRSMLRIEMKAAERSVLTLFAASFLEWIRDARNSRFASDAGAPASVSFDETAADDATATLRVTVTWPLRAAGPSVPALRAVPIAPIEAAAEPGPSLFYEAQAPVSAPEPPPVDLTSMVVEVFERSKTLHQRSPRGEHALSPRSAPLGIAAARARQWVTRWTAGAGSYSRDLLDRGRGRDGATSWRASGATGLDGLRVVVRLPKVSMTGAGWVPWATAALCLAAVIYVAWPTRIFTSTTVLPPVIAESAPAPAATSGAPAPPQSRVSAPDGARDEAAAGAAPPTVAAAPLPRHAAVSPPVAVVPAAAAARAKPAPAKPAPAPTGYFGSLVITSDPGGAEVTIDGLPRGRTPLSIHQLTAGSRVVRVDMPGHQPWAWAVSVVANKETAVAVKLVPAAPPHDSAGADIDRAFVGSR